VKNQRTQQNNKVKMPGKEEISAEMRAVQQKMDQLYMEIGQGYAALRKTGDSKIVIVINSKVELVQKLEERMDELKQELDRL
jgi:uncharacterized protein with PhoU and TrkA domain